MCQLVSTGTELGTDQLVSDPSRRQLVSTGTELGTDQVVSDPAATGDSHCIT